LIEETVALNDSTERIMHVSTGVWTITAVSRRV
jgi:hypothetical protein